MTLLVLWEKQWSALLISCTALNLHCGLSILLISCTADNLHYRLSILLTLRCGDFLHFGFSQVNPYQSQTVIGNGTQYLLVRYCEILKYIQQHFSWYIALFKILLLNRTLWFDYLLIYACTIVQTELLLMDHSISDLPSQAQCFVLLLARSSIIRGLLGNHPQSNVQLLCWFSEKSNGQHC